jgi:radical SAM superfamily enzyme YgiQ (UPF0313 family)
MHLLLVNTNRNRHLSPPPLGLAFLASALKAHGHEVRVADLMFAEEPGLALRAALDESAPGLVGFSIRNLDTQTMLDPRCPLPEIRELVSLARVRGIPTVLGGTAFTTLPREMLEYMRADYGIAGDGEPGLIMLAEALERGATCTDAPGLVWQADGEVHSNPPVIRGHASGAHPDWGGFDWSHYRRTYCPPAPGVLVKTGCPYGCSYCDGHTSMGRDFVLREPLAIIDDLRVLCRQHDVTSFFLVDHCFNSPLDHAKGLLAALIRARLDISVTASIGPVGGCYDDEFFGLFRQAGGIFLVLDTDSLSPTMLSRYHKPFQLDDVIRCAEMARRHDVHFGVEMLFGGPGETYGTVRETIRGLERLDFSRLSYNIGVRILPDTPLCATALAEGVIQEPRELLFPKFYLSPELDLVWARRYIAQAAKRYARRHLRLLPFRFRNLLRRRVWHGL